MYKCEHFDIRELVPSSLHESAESVSELWLLFDKVALIILDYLREDYGKMICNDWVWGGENHYRGFRPFSCDVGAALSQHKFGRAFDVIPSEKTSVEQIRQDISEQKKNYMKYISAIEMEVDWLHFDIRNTLSRKVLKIWPS